MFAHVLVSRSELVDMIHSPHLSLRSIGSKLGVDVTELVRLNQEIWGPMLTPKSRFKAGTEVVLPRDLSAETRVKLERPSPKLARTKRVRSSDDTSSSSSSSALDDTSVKTARGKTSTYVAAENETPTRHVPSAY
jgi:hypothetical protein